MSACPHHKETLMFDIFGELNHSRRAAWDKHLSSCSDCAAEKSAIARTLKIAKAALGAPSLEETEAAAMRERVIRDLTAGPEKLRERKQPFFYSRAFIPALASACILLMAAGFMASKFLTGPDIDKMTRLAAIQAQLPAEDIEIINNMDLLGDLDALDKLSRAIDQPKPPSPHNNVQGKSSHGQKPIFI